MDTSYTICHQCKRESFSEETAVVRCPYCGSKRIETSIVPNQSETALSVMGFDKLSEEQKAIVLSTEGINYVEAGPGTAKSTTLVFRARYLTHYRRDGIRRPLILTLTHQAADQIARSFLNERPQDRPQVASLHRFVYGNLRKFRNLLPYEFQDFRVMNEDDWNLFITWNRTHNPTVDGKLSGAELKKIVRQKKRAFPYISALMYGMASDDPSLSAFLSYQRENCLLDFDDLTNALAWVMKNNPDVYSQIADRYRYVLVDEAQALTASELKLLNMITSRYRNLFLAGDSDQSICGEREVENPVYDWLESLDCEVHRFVLSNNYRSSQAILDAAKSLIEAAPNRKPETLKAVNPDGVKVMVKECPDPSCEVEIIASSIELAADPSQPHPLKYSDIAVLARNHESLRPTRDALIEKNIPVGYDSATPLLQRPVIQSVIRHLRFLDAPNYLTMSALDETLIPEKHWPEFWDTLAYVDGWVSDALMLFADDDDEDEAKLTVHGYWFEKVLDAVNQCFIDGERFSLTIVLETILTEFAAADSEAERDIDDFRILCRKLLKKSGNDLSLFLDLLTFAAQEGTETEEQQNYVHLLTLHGSKGRQFKKVFIAGVNASLIPDPQGDYEEERRLLYVGVTRAEKELVISYYRNSFGRQEEPSPFLADVLRSQSAMFCPAEDDKKKRKSEKNQ
ncbi:MAG: UvrD-helicase domain-containing protein [Lentisphaeria bacterium]|nr:UvrD-helicase domain-containing protein [Lentisphaeria bacterium]